MDKILVLFLLVLSIWDQVLPFENDTNIAVINTFEPKFESSNQSVQNDLEETSVRLPTASNSPNDVHFYAFTKFTDRRKGLKIEIGDKESVKKSGFVKGNTLLILLHAFMDYYYDEESLGRQAKHYVNFHPDVNVVVVDWDKLSGIGHSLPLIEVLGFASYFSVLQNVHVVGKKVAQFVEFMVECGFVDGPEAVYLVGHSVGAHVAGSTGYYVQKIMGKKVGRITGTDPAGPFMNLLRTKDKLSRYKASFVDVVHTSIDFLGTPRALGHVDFYANGGKTLAQTKPCLTKNPIAAGAFACPHNIALVILDETVSGKPIQGCRCLPSKDPEIMPCPKPDLKKCTDVATFGHTGSLTARGKFYLQFV